MRNSLMKPVQAGRFSTIAALALAAGAGWAQAPATVTAPAVVATPRPASPVVHPKPPAGKARNGSVRATGTFGSHVQPAKPAAASPESGPVSAGQAASAPVSSVPPAVVTPRWPVNEPAVPAQVSWDSQGLRISAANSSLSQILKDVAARTGARLEGVSADERVFGEYGPGQARDVLAQLLHGSGYNLVLIGDQGQGTPRQIVLSRRSGSAGAQMHAASQQQDSDDDSDSAQQDEPPEQPQQPIEPALRPRLPMQPGQQPGQQLGQPRMPGQPQNQQQPQ